jgi:hypothetical protein
MCIAVYLTLWTGAGVAMPVATHLRPMLAILFLASALFLAVRWGAVRTRWRTFVRTLLDAGGDPNRYNPVGFHSHSTPIHQAALAGHDKLVRLLVERGARVDLKDVLWQGTPADWAKHAGKTEVEVYLRGR